MDEAQYVPVHSISVHDWLVPLVPPSMIQSLHIPVSGLSCSSQSFLVLVCLVPARPCVPGCNYSMHQSIPFPVFHLPGSPYSRPSMFQFFYDSVSFLPVFTYSIPFMFPFSHLLFSVLLRVFLVSVFTCFSFSCSNSSSFSPFLLLLPYLSNPAITIYPSLSSRFPPSRPSSVVSFLVVYSPVLPLAVLFSNPSLTSLSLCYPSLS